MASRDVPTTVGIDWLVTGARADAPLSERAEWLEHLVAWLRSRGGGAGEGAATPATRLRFLLQVLDRQPDRGAEVGGLVPATLREMDAIGLLCETGLPRAHAVFQELTDRISGKLFPALPAPNDLAALFHRLFPDEADGEWVAALPPATLRAIADLLLPPDAEAGGESWIRPLRDAADALMILASHVQAIGMSQRVRRRTAMERPLDSPFATLSIAVREYIEAQPGMVPIVALFFGVPLEVRHVTLSTGQLALASWAHGATIFAEPAFWAAVAGIVVIGFMNLTVSFALAMWVAIRSTGRGAVSRRRLVRAVLSHLVSSPRDFLLPPRAARG